MRTPSFFTASPVPARDENGAIVSPDTLIFNLCKGKYFARMLLVLPLCAAGYFCIHEPSVKAQLAGWASLVLFPLCFIYAIPQLFRSGPVIIISSEGIYDRRFGMGVIPWSAIASIGVTTYRNYRFLAINVSDQTVLRKMPLRMRFCSVLNAAIGHGRITLNFTGLDGDIDDALRYIRTHFPQNLPNEMLPPSMRK